VGCGHRSPALSVRPLLHGTFARIVACGLIYRHYVLRIGGSMRVGFLPFF
jgi:hypothetical protein